MDNLFSQYGTEFSQAFGNYPETRGIMRQLNQQTRLLDQNRFLNQECFYNPSLLEFEQYYKSIPTAIVKFTLGMGVTNDRQEYDLVANIIQFDSKGNGFSVDHEINYISSIASGAVTFSNIKSEPLLRGYLGDYNYKRESITTTLKNWTDGVEEYYFDVVSTYNMIINRERCRESNMKFANQKVLNDFTTIVQKLSQSIYTLPHLHLYLELNGKILGIEVPQGFNDDNILIRGKTTNNNYDTEISKLNTYLADLSNNWASTRQQLVDAIIAQINLFP